MATPSSNLFTCTPIPSFEYRLYNSNWLSGPDELLNSDENINVAFDFDDTLVTKVVENKFFIYRPKKYVMSILISHLNRHDNVFIITGRKKTDQDIVKRIIINNLGEKRHAKMTYFFTGDDNRTKAFFLQKNNIDVFYGDSDSDMLYAIKAKVTPVRILKSISTLDKSIMNVGMYGEYVLPCSQLTE